MADYRLGCRLDADAWADFNRRLIFERPELRDFAAPFPPQSLMRNVSGVDLEFDFAKQGALFWQVFSRLLAKPLSEYRPSLDFGCGCGRLSRMFKGHPGPLHGCDIDAQHVAWMRANLDFVDTVQTQADEPLPYPSAYFELAIGVSVMTHLDESTQDHALRELQRVTRPDGTVVLTLHGERAVSRALWDDRLFGILDIGRDEFRSAVNAFAGGGHAFVPQRGHLASEAFRYGITFLPETYVRAHWGRWFRIEQIAAGALQDFQDVVVMTPRPLDSEVSPA
jgi:SAM-dependent methyltransferase